MTFRGQQWLLRIEWRLAIDYGRACGEGDLVWIRGIEKAWVIVRALCGKSPAERQARYLGK